MTFVERLENLSDYREDYAEVNGVRLHYISVGRGGLMIFLHGFPEYWEEWTGQLAEFGRTHQAVAFDMRGYNLSSKPEDVESYNIAGLIEDLRALAEHLGHRKFTLVAHDWGGGVAWSFATRHPDWLDRLVVVNAPHAAVFARELRDNPAQRQASRYMLLLRGPEAEKTLAANRYAWLAEAVWGGNSRWNAPETIRRRYYEAWSQPGALTGNVNFYRASPLYPPTSAEEETRLSRILTLDRAVFSVKVPTLVIWGEEDEALLIGNLEGLDDYVDDLTVRRVPDGTHWVIHEQPDVVNGMIRDFMRSGAGAGA
ncbi:MAG: alpha/beta hydrolase [Proteobacteria bacterium]|nr:alpha/beta hydrolase [Pseudomonadota bacterium]